MSLQVHSSAEKRECLKEVLKEALQLPLELHPLKFTLFKN